MSNQLICSQCGHIGSSQKAIKGNFAIEIVLWLFFIIPGLIYSIWRSSSRYKVCAKCGATNLIPLDSPVGQKLLADQGKTTEEVTELMKNEKKPVKLNRWIIIVIGFIILVTILSAFAS